MKGKVWASSFTFSSNFPITSQGKTSLEIPHPGILLLSWNCMGDSGEVVISLELLRGCTVVEEGCNFSSGVCHCSLIKTSLCSQGCCQHLPWCCSECKGAPLRPEKLQGIACRGQHFSGQCCLEEASKGTGRCACELGLGPNPLICGNPQIPMAAPCIPCAKNSQRHFFLIHLEIRVMH